MEWWQALILGLVEGLTEYLPVSSTGHLLLAQRLMGIHSSDAADAFAICIQIGAIFAVLGLYRTRVAQMIQGCLGKDPAGFQLAMAIVSAFVPAAVIGLLGQKVIKQYLFAGDKWGLWPTVAAWIVGGLAILVIGAWRKAKGKDSKQGLGLESLTWKLAVIIGLWQCIAMWPGVSRSLVTIVGGVAVGLSLTAAVEFSFLLGLLTLTAATCLDGIRHGGEMLESFGPSALVIGLLSAWISAWLAVKWMVAYLQKHGLGIFGWYRIILGLAVGGAILAGYLH